MCPKNGTIFMLRVPKWDFCLAYVYIDNDINGFLLKRVICHELTHAAMFSYGIDLSIEQEELFADLIATYGEEIIDITNALFKSLKER